jgi:hypothetical protein
MDIPFKRHQDDDKINEMLSKFSWLSDEQKKFHELKKEIPSIDDNLAKVLTNPNVDLEKIKQEEEEYAKKVLEELTVPMSEIVNESLCDIDERLITLKNATLNLKQN